MIPFFEWFRTSHDATDRPWLILGKGPSFSKRTDYDLSRFCTLSLNHAVRETPVLVAHIIDLDVVEACGDPLLSNARYLVMPWTPHVNNRPGEWTLEELAGRHPILRRLDVQGRLLWYNLSSAPAPHGDSPVVTVNFFSAEAALNLLAAAGVRTVRSLGIDGGASYSGEFADLADITRLANGRNSFDRQFRCIAETILRTGIDYAPLDVDSPIRIYVATTEAQMLAVEVLEYSIRKHASMTIQVVPLHKADIPIPEPREPANRPRTPFSFQRFLIPALAGYRGRAVYLDSDMQVFKDLRALWTVPFDGADVLTVKEPEATSRRPQFSVMLLDCTALDWDIARIVASLDAGALTYERLMDKLAIAKQVRAELPPEWNSLERFDADRTALLHYTDMPTQPWIFTRHPLNYLWTRDLLEAVEAGFVSLDEIRDHAARGFIRPSLVYQVEHRIEDSFLLPRAALNLDTQFVAPYRHLPRHGTLPWLNPMAAAKAAARQCYYRSPLARLERRMRDYLEW